MKEKEDPYIIDIDTSEKELLKIQNDMLNRHIAFIQTHYGKLRTEIKKYNNQVIGNQRSIQKIWKEINILKGEKNVD